MTVTFNVMDCRWCDRKFDRAVASCGTGTTWSLYKCPHCEKFMAVGWAIPDGACGPDTKVIKTEPIGPNALRRPDEKLAHILWRTAKQLVSLLEKEYGFGQKAQQLSAPYIGMNSEGAEKPWTVPRGHRAGTDFEPGMTMQEHDKAGSRHLIGYEAHDDIHKRNQQVTASGQAVTVTDEPHVVLRHSGKEKAKRDYAYKKGAPRNYFDAEEMKRLSRIVEESPDEK